MISEQALIGDFVMAAMLNNIFIFFNRLLLSGLADKRSAMFVKHF